MLSFLRRSSVRVTACAGFILLAAIGCQVDDRKLTVHDALNGGGGNANSGGAMNGNSGGTGTGSMSGTGSTSGTGSAPSSGGAPPVSMRACDNPYLIDDFDAGTTQICSTDERHGFWFVYSDDPGATLTPGPSILGGEWTFGTGISGSGLTFSGTTDVPYLIGIGTSFKNDPNTGVITPYDASAFSGVRFMLRSDTESDVVVGLQDYFRSSGGGPCDDGPDAGCDDHPSVVLGTFTTWTETLLCFHDTQSQGFTPAPIVSVDAHNLAQIVFRPNVPGVFDFQVDNLEFLPADHPHCGTSNPNAPFEACAPARHGTVHARGTCATINNFDLSDDTPVFQSDGRAGVGFESPFIHAAEYESGNGAYYFPATPADPEYGLGFSTTGAVSYTVSFGASFTFGPCYDASVYDGIAFDARKVQASPTSVRVLFNTADTLDAYDCASVGCFDGFGADFVLTDDWAPYSATWDELAQEGWGFPATFDPTRLIDMHFQDPSSGATDEIMPDWAVEIDNVRFIGGDDSECKFIGGL